jgi:fructokinase
VASIVKLSEEDLDWLYGDESVVKRWFDRGVSLVVITRGEKGLSALGRDFRVDVPAVSVSVIDTVGAGDTIGAILVEALLEHGLSELSGNSLFSVLERAAKAASITCSRAGANPPWRAELE